MGELGLIAHSASPLVEGWQSVIFAIWASAPGMMSRHVIVTTASDAVIMDTWDAIAIPQQGCEWRVLHALQDRALVCSPERMCTSSSTQ
eukprot:CAMPEP_0118923344 /NCGR_PEP_ID=MMETSP1169-20130426/1908_1 /TAXON_ID=36882 /ORGANISM="Pyramimonas obovata, Strain CCMP722" /LENGTH=88 /DNA_ID=CAMNT_0006864317 /DNA_START=311 /DNA_END=577 /DNA_ORIENTATION=-